jgi:hypothetical protein
MISELESAWFICLESKRSYHCNAGCDRDDLYRSQYSLLDEADEIIEQTLEDTLYVFYDRSKASSAGIDPRKDHPPDT